MERESSSNAAEKRDSSFNDTDPEGNLGCQDLRGSASHSAPRPVTDTARELPAPVWKTYDHNLCRAISFDTVLVKRIFPSPEKCSYMQELDDERNISLGEPTTPVKKSHVYDLRRAKIPEKRERSPKIKEQQEDLLTDTDPEILLWKKCMKSGQSARVARRRVINISQEAPVYHPPPPPPPPDHLDD